MVNPLDDRAVITSAHRNPRASRWIVVLSVPLLFMSMLLLSMQNWSVAQAATEYTVGNCTADPNPYGTIQEAVNAAISGTMINICPNIYSESVNLSLMTAIGDITLRKAAGQAADADVLIAPLVGASLWITPGEQFFGNISLFSIDVTAVDDYGIDFGTYSGIVNDYRSVYGSVFISDVVGVDNDLSGAYIAAAGAVTVINSEFSNNFDFGLYIEYDQSLILDQTAPIDIPNVYIEGVDANENFFDGIFVDAPATVEIYNTEASLNGQGGLLGNGGATGIRIFNYNPFNCSSQALVNSDPFVQIEDVSANDNYGGWGVYVESIYEVYVFNLEVIGNPYDGLAVYSGDSCSSHFIQVTDSYAYSNGWASGIVQPLGEIDTEAIALEFGGFRLESEGDIWVDEGTVAEANSAFGFCLSGEGATRVENSLAVDNLGDGFTYRYYGCSPYGGAIGKAETAEVGVEISGVPVGESYVISNSSAISNYGVGFEVQDAHLVVTMTNVSALRNITGVAFNEEQVDFFGPVALGTDDVAIQGRELDTTGGPTLIFDSLIQSNTNYGVVYGQLIQLPAATNVSIQGLETLTSTNFVHSSIICENGEGLGAFQYVEQFLAGTIDAQLLPNDSHLLSVDARGNWWGHETGPNAEGNDGGQGDTIHGVAIDTLEVPFAPWIDTIHASAVPSPTLVGIPVALAYQFSDAALAYYLNNGIGDPNLDPLFRLIATNGAIDGDLEKYIVNTLIESSATPSAAGIMKIELQGPCGLSPTLEVPVATPAIDVEKTPDVQGVAANDFAVFTVTVANTGDVALTDIVVDDPLVNNCSRASGALGDLGVNGSTTYTCSTIVSTNLLNKINVEGFALINGSAAGDPVTDSDTAQVLIASFTLSKTVFVDGYKEQIGAGIFNPSECALASNITVPVNTTVKYCYTLTNSGDYTLSTHSLTDSHLGDILTNFPAQVGPGESFSTVDAGVSVTKTLTVSTTNVATWTAEIAAPLVDIGAEAVDASIPVVLNAQANVVISGPTSDLDADGILDNVEGSGDTNTNGIPDFLDPAGPTNEPPTEQPEQLDSLFLPSLGNKD